MRHVILRAFVLGFFVASSSPASATILLFDQQRSIGSPSEVVPTVSGGSLPADYGDQVTGAEMSVPGGLFTYGNGGEGFTPDVNVDIFSAAATATEPWVGLWQSGYGDLVNVIFADGPGTAGAPMLNVRLTAAPGYVVDLYSFDLAGFGADYVISGVSVFAGDTMLFSQDDLLVHGDLVGRQHTTIEFATPLSAPELLLQLDVSNLAPGSQDNVAMDSIRFGQTPPHDVPEPASATLLSAWLALAALTSQWRGRHNRCRTP